METTTNDIHILVMIDHNDNTDILNASLKALLVELQKLAALTFEFNKDIDSKNGQEILTDALVLIAQNTTVTMALSNVVIAHAGANGLLKGEVKLHS